MEPTQTIRVPQSRYPDNNPKSALGVLKPGFHAIPPVAIHEMAKGYGGLIKLPPIALLHLGAAMHDGFRKYGLVNWRGNSVAASVYLNAGLRHAFAYRDGEDYAEDSKVHHLGHTLACCAIILDARATGNLIDDRGTKGVFPDVCETGLCAVVLPCHLPQSTHYTMLVDLMLAWWDGQDEVRLAGAGRYIRCHPLGLAMAHAGAILDGLEAGYITDDRPPPSNFSAVAARMSAELKARAAEAAKASEAVTT